VARDPAKGKGGVTRHGSDGASPYQFPSPYQSGDLLVARLDLRSVRAQVLQRNEFERADV
jgi:hypothetical protein